MFSAVFLFVFIPGFIISFEHVRCCKTMNHLISSVFCSSCSPCALFALHHFSYHIPAGLSITGTRLVLSSRESPQGQLIMDLNAAHYPDKAGALAANGSLTGWMTATKLWQVDSGRHRHGGYLMGPVDRSSCTDLLLWGGRGGWKLDSHKPHNDLSDSCPLLCEAGVWVKAAPPLECAPKIL